MKYVEHSPTRDRAGTCPGSPASAGDFSTTHAIGAVGDLAQARSILAKVADHSDTDIARACLSVLNNSGADDAEQKDAAEMLERVPTLLFVRLAIEAGMPDHLRPSARVGHAAT